MRAAALSVVLATMPVSAVLAAPVVIDSFDQTLQGVQAPDSLNQNPVSVSDAAPEAIGGQRTLTAEFTGTSSANGTSLVQAYVDPFAVRAGLSTGAGSSGIVTFGWGNPQASFDLLDGTNTFIDVVVESADLAGMIMGLQLDNALITQSVPVTGSGPETLRFNFSSFAALGEDGSDVSEISLFIDVPSNGDVLISFIGASGTVPVPSAGILVLAGLAALGSLGRRRAG